MKADLLKIKRKTLAPAMWAVSPVLCLMIVRVNWVRVPDDAAQPHSSALLPLWCFYRTKHPPHHYINVSYRYTPLQC